MATPPPRLLLSGDALGRLNQLFKRVNSVNKSTGPFDALLCVGQFFPDSPEGLGELSDYLEGRQQVPIPTYFTGDYGFGASAVLKLASNSGFKTDGIQLCHNLFWLRGSGKFSLHGLSVAYLSGRGSPDAEGKGKYNQDDVDALRALAEEPGIIDIFLTNEWPSGVANKADTLEAPAEILDFSGSDPVVAELVAEIKPRYHIAGTRRIYYAREPYSNNNASHVTRFIGLAEVGNKDKQKFIHAISPTPASAMSAMEISLKPPNTTVSPFVVTENKSHARDLVKRPADDDAEKQYWRYDVSKRQRQGGAHEERLCFKFTSTGACPRGEKCSFRHDEAAREHCQRNVCFDFLNKGRCERGSDCRFSHSLTEEGEGFSGGRHAPNQRNNRTSSEKNCWFCLSSPNVESHLILSVGQSYYCALAKGPLVEDHVLLIPIEHCPNTLVMPSEAEGELAAYKKAITTYCRSHDMAVIFFEWVFHSSHANLQAVPVPFSKASHAPRIFNLAAKKLGFEFETVSQINDHNQGREILISQFDGKSNLFYVELSDGTTMRHLIGENEKFPVQFGREVLAGLLNIADRADWRNCKLSKEDEIKMAEGFKKDFEIFDPARF